MADEINPTPPPREPWWAPRLDRVLSFVGWALAVTLTAYISTRAPTVVVPPAPVAPVEGGEPGKLYVGGAGGEVHPAFGWVDKPDDVKAVVAAAGIPDFADTPAGKAVQGDEDRFLWQAVRKVNDRGPPWYPDVNQQSVGCCVGCGYKHSVDVCQAIQILSGRAAEWKPVAVEVIYGGSRVEVGGGQIGGDGSVGAWAAKWCRDYGVVPMAKYAGADLTEFSPARARQFGSRGVPADIEAEARKFPVKSTALVKTWEDVKRAVAQGYPVAVCSNQGFTMTRDAAGFARPSGQWAHCMAIIGVRGGDRPGAFVLNSWGDQAHTGPVWPADMPVAGFWADAATIDRMVRQGDSFALSDMVGFPSRNPDDWWFIRAEPRNPVRLWADDRYALAP